MCLPGEQCAELWRLGGPFSPNFGVTLNMPVASSKAKAIGVGEHRNQLFILFLGYIRKESAVVR